MQAGNFKIFIEESQEKEAAIWLLFILLKPITSYRKKE